MGEQDVPIREISDARARMSELADELARRMEPEHIKALASEKVTELKEQARGDASLEEIFLGLTGGTEGADLAAFLDA